MTKEELFQIMNKNPVFRLATMDGDQPRVRGMLLFISSILIRVSKFLSKQFL